MVTCVVGEGLLSWSTNSCFHYRTKMRECCSKFAKQRNSVAFECRKLLLESPALQSWFHGTPHELLMRGRSRRSSCCCCCCNKSLGYAQGLRVAYTTTEKKSVAGSLRAKEIGKRRLILLRHASSSWSDRSLKDHERPLSRWGRLTAADIANKLNQPGWFPELILCSDAIRTRETLEIMQAHVSDLGEVEVRFLGSFYSIAAMDGQTAQHLQENILKYSRDDVTTVMCMGHNRGWEEAASLLCGVSVELKTANAALLEAPGSSWQEAFDKAGMGGWKLVGIVKPDTADMERGVL